MYEKGVQTRNMIYQTAKQLFYDKGYEKTKIKEIADTADVPIGLFTYYFKTKDKIVQHIYSEFFTQISLRITDQTREGLDNSILRHAILSWIYYEIIFSDANNRRFYYENLKKTSNYRIMNKTATQTYRRYVEDFNVVISDHDFENILYLDFGARREYFLNFFEKPLNDSTDDVIFLINGILPRLLGIDQNTITTMLYKGINTAKTIRCDDIHFLV
ncbi:TetR/AcrR family transcriptional regulator [Eubacterium sp. 1001713B170207_170306_E7]|uniref:TetR/AcrR family transcriptional regulator n=1 Tax=Eubacterium sp. 1001713B170207_170306_E7 TaxID=2787097 RepID=UPI00189A1619|nr:TetR/AcrR family transcriptional regulator [Eubacterium sp. 1001713B170207_170306_E7]